MSVSQLGSFPDTIANLPDQPNMSAQNLKDALQADCETLWNKTKDIITDLNSRPTIVVDKILPATKAASLSVGDVYIYCPDLP